MTESKLNRYLEEYGTYHRHTLNRAMQWVAVPLLSFSLLGLVWMIPFPPLTTFLNWASFLIAGVIYFYWTLSRPLAIAALLFTSVMSYFIVRIELDAEQPVLVFALLLALALVLRLLGQIPEEKKAPLSLYPRFLLSGPLWLLHRFLSALGIAAR